MFFTKSLSTHIVNNWLKIVQCAFQSCLGVSSVCLLCLAPAQQALCLCQACEGDLPWLGLSCWRCARPGLNEELCARCQQLPPVYDCLQALFAYEWPLNVFIGLLKYRGQLHFAKLLSTFMAQRLSPQYPVECIVPMPLHAHRHQQRGFNQTAELARLISKKLQVPLEKRFCQKIVDHAPQSTLSATARLKNVKASTFKIDPRFKAQHVLIIEDVVTTGATITALSQALKNHGVKTIEVWACCRTL